MTSQLNVDTIVDKAGSGGTNVKIGNTSTYVSDGGAVAQNTVQGIAKVWFDIDGTGTVTVDDSFNARYSAKQRIYKYYIAQDYSPFNSSTSWCIDEKLNFTLLSDNALTTAVILFT